MNRKQTDRRDRHLSKLLSLVLRHQPEALEITLDEQGWTCVDTLIANARRQGTTLDRDDIERIVTESDKQRFALSEDRLRIRANQGHSVEVDLSLPTVTPPERLFHGTVERFLQAILIEGLRSMSRQHVHLSEEEETARRVGQRRGRPVILHVAAGRMAADGYEFFRSENGVWLTAAVPPEYLGVAEADAA